MNELSIKGDKRMTVWEVSEILGVTPEAIKKHIRELFPDLMQDGKTTYLSEIQVTEIKKRMMPTTQVVGATTDIEMRQKAAEVMAWLMRDNEQLKAKNAELEPKGEAFDALQRSSETMSISNCAKHFGLHPVKEVFPYLRERGYLTLKDLPSQQAIDADILALVQNIVKATGMAYPQAVVRSNQLEAWRVRVVPNIKKWMVK